MKRILIAGKLGYHEKNITDVIVNGIEDSYQVSRMGDSYDFFVEANYPNLLNNYVDSVPPSLKNYDVVLFIDFWNMIFPFFQWKKSVENPSCKFVGLCHGTVEMENDVALMIQKSKEYEKYLLSSYDHILVHDVWLKELMGNGDNLNLARLPLQVQFERPRPELKFSSNIYFIHRFNEDKGSDIFIDFIKYCRQDLDLCNVKFYIFGETDSSYRDDLTFYLGHKNQEEIKNIVQETGGYAWASVRSEIAAYGINDLVSYGLTPLLNTHPAYDIFQEEFKYSDFEEAKNIIISEKTYSNLNWENAKENFYTIPSIAHFLKGVLKWNQ